MKLSETFWLTVLGQIQQLATLIGVVLFLTLPRPKKRAFHELGMILVISFATDAIAWAGVLVFHQNMNIVPNIYRLFNLPLVVLMYRAQTNWQHRNIAAFILIAAFEIFAIVNLLFIQGYNSIDSYTSSLASFCIVLMSMTYLFGYEPKSPIEPNAKPPMHWINIAFLFYYCTTFFINLWVDYLVNVLQSNLISIWMVHNSLGVIFYATLCYALVLLRHQDVNATRHSTQTSGKHYSPN